MSEHAPSKFEKEDYLEGYSNFLRGSSLPKSAEHAESRSNVPAQSAEPSCTFEGFRSHAPPSGNGNAALFHELDEGVSSSEEDASITADGEKDGNAATLGEAPSERAGGLQGPQHVSVDVPAATHLPSGNARTQVEAPQDTSGERSRLLNENLPDGTNSFQITDTNCASPSLFQPMGYPAARNSFDFEEFDFDEMLAQEDHDFNPELPIEDDFQNFLGVGGDSDF